MTRRERVLTALRSAQPDRHADADSPRSHACWSIPQKICPIRDDGWVRSDSVGGGSYLCRRSLKRQLAWVEVQEDRRTARDQRRTEGTGADRAPAPVCLVNLQRANPKAS